MGDWIWQLDIQLMVKRALKPASGFMGEEQVGVKKWDHRVECACVYTRVSIKEYFLCVMATGAYVSVENTGVTKGRKLME